MSFTVNSSLSVLLIGLFPACVMPFLIRRIGFQRAHYLTLMTKPISVEQAHTWGLLDAYDTQSDGLVRQHLLRLRYLSKKQIRVDSLQNFCDPDADESV